MHPEENARAVDAHETLELRYQWELIYKYSSLYKLLKIVSYCLRFILNILKRVRQRRLSHSELFIKVLQNSNLGYNSDLMAKSVPNVLSRLNKDLSIPLLELSFMNIEQTFFFNRFISPIELNRSRCFVVYLHQNLNFSKEKHLLQLGRALPKSSQLIKLNPIMDGDLIRVSGRLADAQLPHDTGQPLLLSPKDHFTRLEIKRIHADSMHGNMQLTLGTLRLQYWLVRGRVAVHSAIKRCHKCILYSKKS